jgi:membrane associated rhomboid family serine protease
MPAWDEIKPSTARTTHARRLTVTNVLIGLNVVGFFAAVLSYPLRFAVFRDVTSFSAELALDRFWIWQFVSHTFVHSIEPLMNLFPFLLCCYLLHEKGGELEREIGWRRYLALYLGAALYGAVLHAAVQVTFGSAIIPPAVGFFGPVMAVFLVHAMRTPERMTLFLLLIPMRALTVAVLSATLLLLYCAILFKAGVFSVAGASLFAFAMTAAEVKLDATLDAAASKRERAKFVEEVEVRREVDRILEKISKEGMDNLTANERRLLKRASRILQDGKSGEHE